LPNESTSPDGRGEALVLDRHRVTQAQLDEVASGVCSPTSMRVLRECQLSRQLLLLRHLADAAPDDDALAVLDAARERDPAAAAWVLADPMVGAWTAYAVRKLHDDRPDQADLGQLAAVAAVAAARAGVDADLPMTHRPGDVTIPTVGLISDAGATLRLRVRSGRLKAGDSEATPLRRLIVPGGPARSVTLDDVSPYRNVFHTPPQPRLDASEVERWQALFAGGWNVLAGLADERATATAELVRTIVPLRGDDTPAMLSATARHVFGALGTTMPSSAAGMAVTLIHEGSHSVLNGLIQLESLFDPKDPALYFAPWRADPRPIWGLFHGVFAFLAVAEVMNRLRAEPAQESAAEKQFAKVRRQLRPALDSLLTAPSLTDSGRQFAGLMEARLARLEKVPVSRLAGEFAARALNDDRTRWHKRNGRTN
jgi:HEXXH motif-containing protein